MIILFNRFYNVENYSYNIQLIFLKLHSCKKQNWDSGLVCWVWFVSMIMNFDSPHNISQLWEKGTHTTMPGLGGAQSSPKDSGVLGKPYQLIYIP